MTINAKDALAAVRAAREQITGGEGREVEYPDLTVGGAPFVCYVWPKTLAESDAIGYARETAHESGQSQAVATMVETVIQCARNADRSRIFAPAQRNELRALADSETLAGLYLAILEALATPDPEAVAKNSESPISVSD